MSGFTPVPNIRVRPCIGSLLDIPAGKYYKGKHGDNILNGGFSNFIGFGGVANSFKTTLAISMAVIVISRLDESTFRLYDTETTFTPDRIGQLAERYPDINWSEASENGRIIVTSSIEHMGEDWWDILKESGADRAKHKKSIQKETPFLDKAGFPIKSFVPEIHMVDSLSKLTVSALEKSYGEHDIDSSKLNTDSLRGGAIKTRLVTQAPITTVNGGLNLLATAHIGKEFKLDPYAPNVKSLSFMKTGLEFKNVPKNFTFLTSLTWMVTSAVPLLHKTLKTTLYPLKGHGNSGSETDLQELTIINLRSKHGATGQVFKLLVSQFEGLLPGLSEFHFLKSRKDKFGLSGPEGVSKDFRLVLYPEPLLKRTKVRELVDEDPKLRRALEITSEMAQIYDYWYDFPVNDRVSPKDLYAKLKEMGYDWDILLDTRGHWTFDHYTNPVHPLSTMDLIDMYHGRYIPFWYPDKDKLTVINKESDDVKKKSS